MDPESNPLRGELARSRPPGSHPDPDVLTAFTEGSLLKRERSEVLQHLSVCAECREVVNLTMDAAPEVATRRTAIASPAGWGYRQWMPWAVGLAACLAVAIALVTVHRPTSKTDSRKKIDYVAKVEQPAAPPVADSFRQVRPEAPPKKSNAPAVVELQKKSEFPADRKYPLQDEVQSRSIQAPAAPAASPPQDQSAAKDLQFAQAQTAQQQVSVNGVTQTVEVTPTPASLAPVPQSIQGLGSLSGEGKARGIASAKAAAPAAQPSVAGLIASRATEANFSARVHWRISPEGRVERQVGTEPWELELPAELARMRVVSVFGGTVWVGGDEQRLYRSSDNGLKWVAISLPPKGTATHSIVHIRFTNSNAGIVDAEDGAQWITIDGGITWQ